MITLTNEQRTEEAKSKNDLFVNLRCLYCGALSKYSIKVIKYEDIFCEVKNPVDKFTNKDCGWNYGAMI